MNDYFRKMAEDGRLIKIWKDGKSHTFLTFSICDDYRPYAYKALWQVLSHNPSGRICFIEKIVSRGWSKQLRKEIQDAIISRFPSIEEAVWFRPTNTQEERKVTWRRHASHV